MPKKPKKLTTTKKILISALIVCVWAGSLLFIYNFFMLNPWMEALLRQQFGEGFFDFSMFSVADDNAEDLEGIMAKYEPVFESLQDTAEERLEELYQFAITEYHEEKEAGTYDRFQLTNKYLQAGQLLERTVDQAFYNLLENMEKELKHKELPTDIVFEIEKTYKEAKQEKKENIFDRLREQLER